MGQQPHAGHRARLKRRAELEGLSSFQPHEVLELMLFTTLPLRDLNPLAHSLIERFGSVSGVLHADASDLIQVSGMGLESAAWIKLLCEAAERYCMFTAENRPRLDKPYLVFDYCRNLFSFSSREQTFVLSLDMAGRLLGISIPTPQNGANKYTLRSLMEPVIKYRAQSVLLITNREGGDPTPSQYDLDMTRHFITHLDMLGILLLDSIIISDEHAVSLRKDGYHIFPDEAQRPENNSVLSETRVLWDHWLDET